MRTYFSRWRHKAACPPRAPVKRIFWSWLGSFVGIWLIAALERSLDLGDGPRLLLIGSFGATAVLLYGAPQADFSQPRNLIGGHVLSALIGVTVTQQMSGQVALACALAVSLSIVVMHLTRTLHPPGGATALLAVTGGESIGSLGYGYVWTPVFTGALILLVIALAVNNLSRRADRHYPTYWY